MKNSLFLLVLVLACPLFSQPVNVDLRSESSIQSLMAKLENEKLDQYTDKASALNILKAHYYKGYILETDNQKKKDILKKGAEYGKRLLEKSKDDVDYLRWTGVLWSAFADVEGQTLNAIQPVNDAVEEFSRSLQLRPDNLWPAMVRGVLKLKAPGWPISVGDHAAARADLEKAMVLGDKECFYFMAQLLWSEGKKAEARDILQKGIALPLLAEDPIRTGFYQKRMIALAKEYS